MTETRWWWDLRRGRAVTDEERGPDKDVLGPYPTKAAAEAWREGHQQREEEWKAQDEEWAGDDEDDGPA